MAERIIDTSPITEWGEKYPDQLKRVHEAYGHYPIFKDGQIVGRKKITLEDQMKDRGLKEASVLSDEDSRVIDNQMSLLGNQIQKLDAAWAAPRQRTPENEKLREAYLAERARLAQAHGALNLSNATYNALDNLNVDKINRLQYGGPWAHRDEPLKPTDTSNFPQDSDMWYDWRKQNPLAPARTGPWHGSGISPLGVMGYPITNPQLTAHDAQQITGSNDFKRNISPLLTEGVKYKESKDGTGSPTSSASAGYVTVPNKPRDDGTFVAQGAKSITLHTHGGMAPHSATIDHESVHAAQAEAMKGRPIDNPRNMSAFDEPHASFYDSGVQYGYTDTSAWDPISKAAADKMFGVGTDFPTVDPKLTRWENARYYGGNLGMSVEPNYQNWVEKFAPHAPPLVTQGLPKLPSGGSLSVQIGLPEGSNVPTY